MRGCLVLAMTLLFTVSSTVHGATFTFDSDPFAGSDVLTTPGRQVVGGEPSIAFDPATDVFVFDPGFFAVNSLTVVSDIFENIPSSGANVIVLQTFEIPFNAGIAANLIASSITTSGAGFFVYFNSALDVPRLVYSTDLSDNTSDLKILAHMANFSGEDELATLSSFSAANFDLLEQVPEPSSAALLLLGAGMAGRRLLRRVRS